MSEDPHGKWCPTCSAMVSVRYSDLGYAYCPWCQTKLGI